MIILVTVGERIIIKQSLHYYHLYYVGRTTMTNEEEWFAEYSAFYIYIKANKQTRCEGLVSINQYFIVGLLIIPFNFTTNLSVSD